MDKYSKRYMCSILDNMRECCKTLNFSYLPALIEEAQYRAERMEDKIEQIHDHERYADDLSRLKNEVRKLRTEKERLE